MSTKLTQETLENLLRMLTLLHEEQRPRGDQLEISDEVILSEFPRFGITDNQFNLLDFLKRSLRGTPRLFASRWLSYDSAISSVTVESIATPERLEWLAEKVKIDIVNRLETKIRELSWVGFEQFVRDVVEQGKGLAIQGTGKSHDGGVDFIGKKHDEEDELSVPLLIVGQAKRWKRKATRDDVAAFIGNVDMKPLPKRGQKMGIYICCSGFTDDARLRRRGLLFCA